MGAGSSITSVFVQKTDVRGELEMVIDEDSAGVRYIIPFSEESEVISDNSKDVINPRFCLQDNMDPNYCGTYLSPSISKEYIQVKGDPCKSFSFRPGSVIKYNEPVSDSVKAYVKTGYLCKFVKSPLSADDKYKSCCTNPTPLCPNRLNNNFETDDCDLVMSSACKDDPNNILCLDWLRKKRKIALSTYSDICAKNMDSRYCSEFIRIVRPENYAFGDSSLINYCNDHSSNKNCWCVNPPKVFADDKKNRFLGPRVCWKHECTDNTRDRKWLLYNQDVQRTRCRYVGCSINIDSLTMEKSNVSLISNCHAGIPILGDVDPGNYTDKNKSKEANYALISIPVVFVVIMVIVYFICVYSRSRLKTNIINVTR
ncbi:myristylated protein, essential for entry/fusion [Pteropox virus]|uniref:Myristylated protein, essential for entry/fusion n=1 Tax=Pteropox virus TaxID=1873698 RepID=A0A1B1MRN3_9POXV|nr:myristylated protein, essential for entry/fusion [Pteropox virus]ANS71195.1 myristylated protein, essential for entry/fusion [Pteropox virus]